MSAGEAPTADPALVEAWITGWALARGKSPPAAWDEGFRVEVGWPDQRERYVFPAACEGLRRLFRTIEEPWVHVKACIASSEMRMLTPERWAVRPPGFMMVGFDGPPADPSGPPEGYRVVVDRDRAVRTVCIQADDGEPVAGGRVAVVGEFAIYDRIVTREGHRRRGLATTVMRALHREAWDQGAACGVLVATQEGRGLHEALGWRLHSPYATAVIPRR